MIQRQTVPSSAVEPPRGAEPPRSAEAPVDSAGQVRPQAGRGRSAFRTVNLRNIKLHAVTEAQTIAHILQSLDRGAGGVVITPNLDILRQCQHDMRFRALVQEADLCVADGRPLIWASRLQGTPLPERVAGSDLISSLSAAAAGAGRSIFLLGGAPGVAEGAAAVLTQRNPALKVVGCYSPPFGFERHEEEVRSIGRIVAQARPDIVFAALGSPKQEFLIDQIRHAAPRAWWLGVGASFDFLTGQVRRAPRWMQRSGLEWLHRLFQQPRRLFRRYVIHGLPFAAGMLLRSTVKGVIRLVTWPLARRSAPLRREPAAPQPSATLTPSTPRPASSPSSLRAVHLAPVGGMPACLKNLRALVLLSGQLRSNDLVVRTGRSQLDLPLDEQGSLLRNWLEQARQLTTAVGLSALPVRVLVARNSPEPDPAAVREFGSLRVERDLSELRGTGGVLGDLAADFADDDLLLVANGAQIMLEPLWPLVVALGQRMGDVAILAHHDGTPATFMLLRCGALRSIPRQGFVDMKEQALPSIARRHEVNVLERATAVGLPIRSLSDYITALRSYHRLRAGALAAEDPWELDHRPAFTLVEPGAVVDPAARVHDSVVLRGARVEADAVVVRSVVCGGATVRRDRMAVDEIIAGSAAREANGSSPKAAGRGEGAV